ncbi:MAG: TIR domain-containing protein [Burkholderiales bacterium]
MCSPRMFRREQLLSIVSDRVRRCGGNIKRWRSEIARGLAESHMVVVFWCDHASRSDEVSKEWNAAIEQKKDLLPLLLDATPLPPELGEFQWIDFRGTVGPNHSSIVSSANDVRASAPPLKAPVKSGRWLSLAGLTAVFVAAVALSLATLDAPQLPPPSPIPGPPGPTPLPSPPPPEVFDLLLSKNILLPLALLLAVAASLAWWLRRRSQRRRSIESARPHPSEFERRIASEIETEILRRTALRRDAGA